MNKIHFPKNNYIFQTVGLIDEEQPKAIRAYLFQPKPFKNGIRLPFRKVNRFEKK